MSQQDMNSSKTLTHTDVQDCLWWGRSGSLATWRAEISSQSARTWPWWGLACAAIFEACQQLMDEDLLGVRRLAVVRDEFEMHQVRRVGLCPACLMLPGGRKTSHACQPAKQAQHTCWACHLTNMLSHSMDC